MQENGPEQVPAKKQALFAELDQAAKSPIRSLASTDQRHSGERVHRDFEASRALFGEVAHPVNPPYLGACSWRSAQRRGPARWRWRRTRDLMHRAGQVPATVKKEMDGFALNRLQGALLARSVPVCWRTT